MELFVLRHGDAENASTDDIRPLSILGQSEVNSVMSAMKDRMQSVQVILASPLLRAQQTADIARSFLPAVKVETTSLLVPEASMFKLCEFLQQRSESSILMVSHQPLVGTLVSNLCGKSSGYYSMGTANLACIHTEIVAPDCGDLQWLQRPNKS